MSNMKTEEIKQVFDDVLERLTTPNEINNNEVKPL